MLVVDDLNLTTKKKKNVMGMGFVKHIVGLLSSKTMGLENFEHIQELCLLYLFIYFFIFCVGQQHLESWNGKSQCSVVSKLNLGAVEYSIWKQRIMVSLPPEGRIFGY